MREAEEKIERKRDTERGNSVEFGMIQRKRERKREGE